MADVKQYKVGLIKSIAIDPETGQFGGIIETVNDQDNPELPFVMTETLLNIKKGKMVKFIKKAGSLVPRATDITEI